MSTNDDTKATHVITVGSADVQGVFKIQNELPVDELVADIYDGLRENGYYKLVDPDTEVVTMLFVPPNKPVVIQVWTEHRYRVTMIQARAAQAQQQGGPRIVQ